MIPLLLLLSCAAPSAPPDTSLHMAPVALRVDDHRHIITVTVGPFQVPVGTMDMRGMDMATMAQSESLVARFQWPATRKFHSVELAVFDGHGGPLPRRLLHHTYMVNFDRRMLLYPLIERTFSFGEETSDLETPAMIGMPMTQGHHMGVIVMWNNETGRDIDSAYVRYTFRINPRHQWPAPTAVIPFLVDAHLVVAGFDTFSVAPGGRTVASHFMVPISGHLLAAGGHLHDHALQMRIEDERTGKVLVRVRARRDSTGHVLGVSRALPGIWGAGPHLKAGHPYRAVVVYDNPTADTLVGMMGLMGAVFVPDRHDHWPALDLNNPDTQADIRQIVGTRAASAVTAHRS